jgi:methionyl-tRNA formyltransferase
VNLESSILSEESDSGTSRLTSRDPIAIGAPPFKHAPKIFTETCKIDFAKTTQEVHNLIRGLSPFPGAFTELNGKTLKIFRSEKSVNPDNPPGQIDATVQIAGNVATGSIPTFTTDGKTYLHFACSDGYIAVKELQLEGKKKMSVTDFLKGYRFE